MLLNSIVTAVMFEFNRKDMRFYCIIKIIFTHFCYFLHFASFCPYKYTTNHKIHG